MCGKDIFEMEGPFIVRGHNFLRHLMIKKAIEMPKDEFKITFRLCHQLSLNYDIIAF